MPAKSKKSLTSTSKKAKVSKKEVITKRDIEGFKGSLPLDFKKIMKSGKTLREELSKHIDEVLTQEIKNQAPRIKKLKEWQDLYKGHRDERTWPFPHCANTTSPLTRSNTDAIHVRIHDALFNKRKFWIMKASKPSAVGIDREIEDYLDWFQRNILKMRVKLQSPLLQCVKTGTGVIKLGWESKKRTSYRYATKDEIKDKSVTTYKLPGSKTPGIKYVHTEYEGPQIYGIPREDWIISSDATSVQDAYLCGFKFTLRKPEIELRVRQGIFYKEQADKLIAPDRTDPVKEGRAEAQHKKIEYIESTKPFEIWELWTSFDVDEDGEEDDIVLTFHKETGTLLNGIYNPLFIGFKPFVPLVFYPHEYCVDGEGIAEILESIQYEIDSMHNQKIDRLTQINNPVLFVNEGSNLAELEYLEPGKVYVADMDVDRAIKEFRWSDTTYSIDKEVAMLMSQGDRAVGITPNVLGISTAERPVAKETFANIQEANKKFQHGIANLRMGLAEIAYMIIEFYSQYQPTYKYTTQTGAPLKEGAEPEWEVKKGNFPIHIIRDGLEVELFASTELLNQEVRREVNIAVYQMLSDFYTKTAGMVEALLSPEVPAEFKKFLLSIMKKGDERIEKVLEDFDQADAEMYRVDIEKVIDVQKALTMPPPPPPQVDEQGNPIEEGGQSARPTPRSQVPGSPGV